MPPLLILNRTRLMFHQFSNSTIQVLAIEGLLLLFIVLADKTCVILSEPLETLEMLDVFYLMETIVVTVTGVKVFVDEKSASVQLTSDKAIKGFVRQADGTFAEADVNTISIHRSKLTAQLCDASDDIAMYRATLDHAFGQKEFGVILFKAQLTLNRQLIAAGEVIGEGDDAFTAERDCYLTDVTKVKLSEKALRELDKATSL